MKGGGEPSDVIVVGGGIVGVAWAEACAAAGLKVRLIEEDRVGSGTTRAGMGHVVLMPGELLELTRYSQQLWGSRAADWVGQVPIRPVGTIWVARTEGERARLGDLESELSHVRASTERLESEELHRQEPDLSPSVTEGLWVKDDLVVDPSATAVRLSALAQARKAEVMEGMRVEAVVEGGVRLAEGTALRADRVVVCTGVETPRLLPELGIRPRKGHILHLSAPAGHIRAQLAEVGYVDQAQFEGKESIAFNVHPATSGGVWLGTSRENGADSQDVEGRVVQAHRSRAKLFLKDAPSFPIVRSWAGLRPASPDHRPFIGAWPGRPDLLVAVGHEGLGVTTSLATGQLIVDLLLGRRSKIDRRPFALDGRLPASAGGSDPAPTGRRGAPTQEPT